MLNLDGTFVLIEGRIGGAGLKPLYRGTHAQGLAAGGMLWFVRKERCCTWPEGVGKPEEMQRQVEEELGGGRGRCETALASCIQG